MADKIPKELLDALKKVTAKRAKTVIDHILKHGKITTDDLQILYKYKHPPRGARDVREQGIPLDTFKVKAPDGRTIAEYRFAIGSTITQGKLGGRKIFSKQFKLTLMEETGCKCAICLEEYESRYLQVDHRVPYEVTGDTSTKTLETKDHMLLCGSCNRGKSWSCEHCENWQKDKIIEVCKTCYWASPDNYTHIAKKPIRRQDIVWTGKEVVSFDKLNKEAKQKNVPVQTHIKDLLKKVK